MMSRVAALTPWMQMWFCGFEEIGLGYDGNRICLIDAFFFLTECLIDACML